MSTSTLPRICLLITSLCERMRNFLTQNRTVLQGTRRCSCNRTSTATSGITCWRTASRTAGPTATRTVTARSSWRRRRRRRSTSAQPRRRATGTTITRCGSSIGSSSCPTAGTRPRARPAAKAGALDCGSFGATPRIDSSAGTTDSPN